MFYPASQDECRLISSETTLGRDCLTSAECRGNGEYCNDRQRKCVCLSNFVEVSGKCMSGIFPGNMGCFDSRQCSIIYPNAICTPQGQCRCPRGLLAKAGTCVLSAYPIPSSSLFPFMGGVRREYPFTLPSPLRPALPDIDPQIASNGVVDQGAAGMIGTGIPNPVSGQQPVAPRAGRVARFFPPPEQPPPPPVPPPPPMPLPPESNSVLIGIAPGSVCSGQWR